MTPFFASRCAHAAKFRSCRPGGWGQKKFPDVSDGARPPRAHGWGKGGCPPGRCVQAEVRASLRDSRARYLHPAQPPQDSPLASGRRSPGGAPRVRQAALRGPAEQDRGREPRPMSPPQAGSHAEPLCLHLRTPFAAKCARPLPWRLAPFFLAESLLPSSSPAHPESRRRGSPSRPRRAPIPALQRQQVTLAATLKWSPHTPVFVHPLQGYFLAPASC